MKEIHMVPADSMGSQLRVLAGKAIYDPHYRYIFMNRNIDPESIIEYSSRNPSFAIMDGDNICGYIYGSIYDTGVVEEVFFTSFNRQNLQAIKGAAWFLNHMFQFKKVKSIVFGGCSDNPAVKLYHSLEKYGVRHAGRMYGDIILHDGTIHNSDQFQLMDSDYLKHQCFYEKMATGVSLKLS
jgi:hypothetical protein